MFRFQRWRANLRILEVDEIKTVPDTPLSHSLVERLIGTIRREYLDLTLFWNRGDLESKFAKYQAYYNHHRCHTGLAGSRRRNAAAYPRSQSLNWSHMPGGNIATAYFRPQLPPELQFATDTSRGSRISSTRCRRSLTGSSVSRASGSGGTSRAILATAWLSIGARRPLRRRESGGDLRAFWLVLSRNPDPEVLLVQPAET